MEGSERGRLDGPPETVASPQPARPEDTTSAPASGTPQSADSFDFNQPTIISLLYLSSFFLGITSIVGVVLAYVWKSEPRADWEVSHYQYLINTFWIGLIGGIVGVMLLIVLIGLLILPLVFVLVVVRCVLSLINAQKKRPMPNPGTLLA
jgi:uncharacterized membrane protein